VNYFITHCDINFIEHVEKLFESLNKFSNTKIIFYSIDFTYKSKYSNVISVRYDVDKNLNTLDEIKAYAVFLKPLICLNVFDLPFINKNDTFCYIDADCLGMENCDDIFLHQKDIINYPLLNNGCHDYMILDGRGDPFINDGFDLNHTLEAPLINVLNHDINNRKQYLQTGVFIFNHECLEFLDLWRKTCFDKKVLNNWKYLTPFHEETVINCLLWQKNILKSLGQVLINIPYYSKEDDDLIKVKNLFDKLKYPPNKTEFLYTFTKVPEKENFKNICFLHGKHSQNVYDFINYNMSDMYLRINSPSLGDTIASTPTLRKLSKTYNKKINVITHVKEVFSNNPYVNKIYSFEEFENAKLKINKNNLFETFLGVGSKNQYGVEKKHNTIDIRQFHAIDLGFMLLNEEMGYDYVADNYENINDLPEEYVCLHVSETWESRTYKKENWQKLINQLNNNGIAVVLIGKNGYETGFYNIQKNVFDLKVRNGIDLTNKLNLSQSWHVINKAKAFITMDSGPLHLAGTTDTFIIQLGSSINNKLRAPYRNNSQDYKYKYISGPCDLFCASDMKYGIKEWGTINGVPPLIKCLENKNTYECHPDSFLVFNFIIENIIFNKDKKKFLFITNHLSTGGAPKYLEWLIQKYNKNNIVKVIEWNLYSPTYTVQRDNIINIIGSENFYSVGGYWENKEHFINKENEVLQIIQQFNPDCIHLNEFSEDFAIQGFTDNILNFLYDKNRNFKLYETSHKAYIDFATKKYIPDELWLCSEYHIHKAEKYNLNYKLVEMDLQKQDRPNRTQILLSLGLDPNILHVLQVGLFCKNKNQKFTFDVAKKMIDLPIQFHFVGNECYLEECGIDKNQLNCKIWGERKDVDVFLSCMDIFVMPSIEELNPISIKEALSWNMPCFISKIETLYNKYKNNNLVNFIEEDNFEKFLKQQSEKFINLMQTNEPNKINVSFNPKPKIEILGDDDCVYKIKFINNQNNFCHFETQINTNMWCEASIMYYVDWRIEVLNITRNVKNVYRLNLTNQIVHVVCDSSSLGDNIAWMSSIDEFQKKHQCKLYYYTNKKDLFEKNYPNINFCYYDDPTKNIGAYASYKIGCFDASDKELCSKDWRLLNLCNIANDILGLEYKQEKPKIAYDKNYKNNLNKYICIATQSTSQSRYWNKDKWEKIIAYLKNKGYAVICVDKHFSFGNEQIMNYCPNNVDLFAGHESFDKIINLINNCEFFIGLSSGLSWLAWALNKNVLVISGSVEQDFEFKTPYRVTNRRVCNGCFNNTKYIFDKSNWTWCPENKNFECSENISCQQVIETIDAIMNPNLIKKNLNLFTFKQI
jgi:hypothetical protein